MNIINHGPGMWMTIHLLSLHATTRPLKDAYVLMMTSLCENFGCEKCKDDFKIYITKMKNYYAIENGLFKWSVDFHNHVNSNLDKPVVEYNEALNKFKNLVCVNCDQTKNVQIIVPTNKSGFNIKSFY